MQMQVFWDVAPRQIVVFTDILDDCNVSSQTQLTLSETSHNIQEDLNFQPQRAANL